MKIAIVHDYLVDRGGAERVVISLSKAFPKAPIYTSVFDPKKTFPYFNEKNIVVHYSKILNMLLRVVKKRERLAPLFPLYFKTIYARRKKLAGYDLVISSSSAFAIDVPHHHHICYCHTPARFIWRNTDYNPGWNPFMQIGLNIISALFKPADLRASKRIYRFLTNSHNMQGRIKQCYQQDSIVIHPSINVHDFKITSGKKKYFFIVSRLKAYKQIDLAIKAFNALGLPLYIAGTGSEESYLRSIAKDNITFLGRVPDDVLKDLYSNARAFIFPGEEDFGITPLESMASGRPIIGFDRGGLRETVVPGVTGILFKQQTVDSLKDAIIRYIENEDSFDPKKIREHAETFDEKVFIKKIQGFAQKIQ